MCEIYLNVFCLIIYKKNEDTQFFCYYKKNYIIIDRDYLYNNVIYSLILTLIQFSLNILNGSHELVQVIVVVLL